MIHENPHIPDGAVIQGIKAQTYDTTTYTLSFRDPAVRDRYRFVPGQFNMMTLFGIGEAPISMSSDPTCQESFDHTVRAVGSVTRALTRMGVGDVVGLRGPFGNQWPVKEAEGKDILIVAGGIGLAPLRPFIMHVFASRPRYGKLEIFYGARTPSDLLFTDEFAAWQSQPGTRMLFSVDKVPEGGVWDRTVGVVTVLFEEMQTRPGGAVALICGPEVMMKFAAFSAMGAGFAPEQIYLSLERRMQCGVCLCGHCQIGSKYVCKDGPVFNYDEIKQVFGPGM
ncbi:MAG: FAD/NAD(P)-binding protein [Armatimonadetes bacterium]|nr:FAD/NAD(P)-binding protein [Armatimonadota bacterium]